MIDIATTVEHDGLDALCLGTFRDLLAYQLGSGLFVAVALEVLFQGRSSCQGMPVHIVDDLSIDVGLAAEYVQTGSLGRAGDLAAHSLVTLQPLSVGIGSVNHLGTPPFTS